MRARPTAAPAGAVPAVTLPRDAWIVTAVAFGARLAVLLTRDGLTYDGTYYLRQAERLRHLRFDVAGFPPGFPAAAALVHLVVPDAVLAARLLGLVAGTATVWLAFRIVARSLPRAVALAAGLFLALDPALVRTHTEVLSEPLHGMLWMLAATAFAATRDGGAGALLGLAHLARPETILGYGAWIALRARRLQRVPWRLCIGLVAVAVYAAAASRAVGHPVLSPKQGQFAIGTAVATRLWTTVTTLHAVFPLVLLPGALWWGARHKREWIAPVLYLATLPLFDIHIQERLHAPALPFLVLLAASWCTSLAPRQRHIWAIVAALELAAGTAPGWKNLFVPQPLVPHARAIGRALAPQLQFESRVAARFPIAPYYGGAGFVAVPNTAPYDAFVDSIQARGATHLLVLESENKNILPQLRLLFENDAFATAEARLQAIAAVDAPVGARAILYAVRPAPITLANSGRAGAGAPAAAAQEAALRAVRAAAAAENPQSPCAIGPYIVYVRGTRDAELRTLDTRTGRVHPVRFAGLARGAATPLAVTARGNEVAVTFAQGPAKDGQTQHVLATGTWPAATPGDTVDVTGRWATRLALYDPRVAWIPDQDALFASVALPDLPERAALCVVTPKGRVRRLSYGVQAARAPVAAAGRLEFLCGTDDRRSIALDPAQLVLPEGRVFPGTP